MPNPPPGGAPSLSFAYSKEEDRLALTIHREDARLSLLLTRRLTLLLVNGLAHILEKSSTLAGRIPAEFRDDIILLEHQQAVQARMEGAVRPRNGEPLPAQAPSNRQPAGELRPSLVSGVNITTRSNDFIIVFKGKMGSLAQIEVSRSELHCILEIFKRRAEAASWGLAIQASWLEREQSEVAIN